MRGPGGWLVKDFADGWFWTNSAEEVGRAIFNGAIVWNFKHHCYVTTNKEEMK